MARSHTMTPARRAALRKAQLASARRRRKGGVGSAVKRSASQRISATKADFALRRSRRVKYRHMTPRKKPKGPGSYAKRVDNNLKYGSRTTKALTYATVSPAGYLVSKARGKRAAKKRRRR
jgi:hypothetical protein